jgi:hypothetical protein
MNVYFYLAIVIALVISLVTYAVMTQKTINDLNNLHKEHVEQAWMLGYKQGYESVSESPLTAKMVYDRLFKYNSES